MSDFENGETVLYDGAVSGEATYIGRHNGANVICADPVGFVLVSDQGINKKPLNISVNRAEVIPPSNIYSYSNKLELIFSSPKDARDFHLAIRGDV